jgi:molecular chaperone HtpG
MDTTISQTSRFKAGMYLLDSFTSGMYNDPLIVYREYIQNAVDSIDLSCEDNISSLEVAIQLEPGTRAITIRDNAMGVPADLAEDILSSVGSSNKSGGSMRGFRGIGRLGGIAFSDRAIFRTKAKNEAVESIQEWDCRTLRKLLGEQKNDSLSLEEVFSRVVSFRQEQCSTTHDSYFEVKLLGVTSFRNQIFDLEKVRRYLSQVTPVPFNAKNFSYAGIIDEYLSSRLSNYGRYAISLNGDLICKPYKDTVRISKGNVDPIDDIEFFEIGQANNEPIAYGWYGLRRKLLGSITRGDDSSGIRVRVGNIQIGDSHLLDFCFREPRFNSYIVGEIHVDCLDLIPNSRRDDFVDNMKKGIFFNLIEKNVGLPISRDIRLKSRLASSNTGFPTAAEEIKKDQSGDMPCNQTSTPTTPQKETEGNEQGEDGYVNVLEPPVKTDAKEIAQPLKSLATIRATCQDCPNLPKVLAALDAQKN